MSSKSQSRASVEAWVLLGAMTLATVWYAWNQLLYSLYFVYQVARSLFPAIVPELGTL